MKRIDGILYLEFTDALKAGFSPFTLKGARRDKVPTWEFIDDPLDNRRSLLRFDTLKDKYKDQVRETFGDPEIHFDGCLIRGQVVTNGSDLEVLRNITLSNGQHLPAETIQSCARACDVLSFISGLTKGSILELGFQSVTSFYSALSHFIRRNDISLPSYPSELRRRKVQYQKFGPACMVSSRFCNQNSRKLERKAQEYLIYLYGDPRKPDFGKVLDLYHLEGKKHNWPQLEESTIRKFLQRGEVQQLWFRYRHGIIPWKDLYGYSISKAAPTTRDSKWESDGSRLNLCYIDQDGQPNNQLQVYLVVDAMSLAILGYHISFRESHLDVYKAFRHAVNKSGHRPYQILYDGSSANTANVTQEFFNRLCHAHFPAQPHNGQSKIIESVFFRLQSEFLKDFPNFTGQNITSKKADSHINKEWAAANYKYFPGRDKVVQQAQMAISAYNYTPWMGGKSPMDHYLESGPVKKQEVSILDMVEMFWLWREDPITYRKDGLTIHIKGEKLRYLVVDENGTPDLDFMESHLLERFQVKYDPWDMSKIRLYKDDRFVAEASRKEILPSAIADYKEGDAKKLRAHIDVRRQQKKRIEKNMDEIRSRVDSEGMLKMGFELIHKDALNRAEGDYLSEIMINKPTDLFKDDSLKEGTILE